MTRHWILGVGITCLWAPFDLLGCGHYTLALSLFFLLPLSLSFFVLFGPAALSTWFAAAPVRLAVRLSVVGCPPAASRPKVGGRVGWLFAHVGMVNLLLGWLYAPGGMTFI